MNRTLGMFVIGLVFGGGIGFTIAASTNSAFEPHDHGNPAHHLSGTSIDVGQAHGEHNHEMRMVVSSDAAQPSLQMNIVPDPSSGWNVQLVVKNFRFSGKNASRDHMDGEGHAHLYVDDVKVARVYGEWFHLDNVPEDAEMVSVALYANNHQPLAVDGEPINDMVMLADMAMDDDMASMQ